jgi:integrase
MMLEVKIGRETSLSWPHTLIDSEAGLNAWELKASASSLPSDIAVFDLSASPEVPRGVHFVPHPTAKEAIRWYVYAWRGGGPLIKISEGADKPILSATDIQRILEEWRLKDNPVPPTLKHMTLGTLADAWQASSSWTSMASNTKRTWGSALRAIVAEFGEKPVLLFYDSRMLCYILEWRKKQAKHACATDNKIEVFRSLLAFGSIALGEPKNILDGVPKLYRGNTRPDIIWLPTELEKIVAAAKSEGKPALAMAILLAAETGLRQADIVRFRKSHVIDGVIALKASKPSRRKRRFVSIPVLPSLVALLKKIEALPRAHGATTVLVDDNGKPWSAARLGKAFSRLRNKLYIVHLVKTPRAKPRKIAKHFHDLRGTFATKLVLAGHSDADIADVMGWSPTKVARIRATYVPQGAKAKAMAVKMQGGLISVRGLT